MTHSELIEAIIQEASQRGLALLFKNQSGVAVNTKMVAGKKKTYRIAYGVGPSGGGGLDLIGLMQDTGQFVTIDAKVGKDKLSASQIKFIRWVHMAGGIAGEARSVEDAIALMTKTRPSMQ